MGSYAVAATENGAYAKALAAATVDTVTFAADLQSIEVISDGTSPIYLVIGSAPAAPTVAGNHTWIVPAGAAPVIRRFPVPTDVGTVVRLISAGTPTYSVSNR